MVKLQLNKQYIMYRCLNMWVYVMEYKCVYLYTGICLCIHVWIKMPMWLYIYSFICVSQKIRTTLILPVSNLNEENMTILCGFSSASLMVCCFGKWRLKYCVFLSSVTRKNITLIWIFLNNRALCWCFLQLILAIFILCVCVRVFFC